MEFEGGLAGNARFGASNFQGERSFSRFAGQAQGFGKAPCLKSCRSLARNARLGSFVASKVEEASHEMLVLEACRLKS